jgi:hypothetical protein
MELAKVIRSKNASPFLTTLDIFFKDNASYERVKKSGIISKKYIARLYNISEKDVVGIYYYGAASGMKITIIKPEASGDIKCPDVYGAQQHVPLLKIEIP